MGQPKWARMGQLPWVRMGRPIVNQMWIDHLFKKLKKIKNIFLNNTNDTLFIQKQIESNKKLKNYKILLHKNKENDTNDT